MLRFVILGSSSSGNAILVYTDTARILVDNGFSFKRLAASLAQLDVAPESLDGVLITHEHADHVRGLGPLARKTGLPIYMTTGCAAALPSYVGVIPNLVCFESGDTLSFNGLDAVSFNVSHDAADPVNYVFRAHGVSLGLATDFGHCSHLTRARLAGANALVVESNYCPDLLRQGPYPPQVQQRIRSRIGHLSNADVQELLRLLYHEALRLVVLCHISRDNNTPELACALARAALGNAPVQVVAAPADSLSPIYEVTL